MKKILVSILLMSSMNLLAEEIRVQVSGMVCSLCAQGIEKKFSKEEVVKDLKVNMDDKLVTLQTHEGKSISDDKITQIITEAGYNVGKIERQ